MNNLGLIFGCTYNLSILYNAPKTIFLLSAAFIVSLENILKSHKHQIANYIEEFILPLWRPEWLFLFQL